MQNIKSSEKAELMKSTISYLYSKEGRSISYISRLLDINRTTVSKKIKEWSLETAPHKRHLNPSNQKFLNKNRNLIKSRLDKDVSLNDIAMELKISRDKLYKTFIYQDEVLQKAYDDFVNRIHSRTKENRQNALDSSKYNYNFQDLPEEEWKEILGYPGYWVSNQGRIKGYSKRYKAYYLMSFASNKNTGRLYVALINKNGERKNLNLARLVAHTFVRGYDNEHNTVNHEDGNVKNNAASNLTWQSQSENNRHAYEKLNRTKVNFKTYKFDYILYKDQYEFKTVAAFSKFLNKSETQTRRYLDNPSKHNIKLINLNKQL